MNMKYSAKFYSRSLIFKLYLAFISVQNCINTELLTYSPISFNIGQKEKEAVEAILQDCSAELRDIYNQTRTGNGQKWLMIDLEDKEKMYADIFRFIDIRRG